jgi:F-type H+-transporting ATPase subunit b
VLVDWFTVGAQALNFLILVWLLKHFLYGPILAAIDAREQRIARELADANDKQAEAQKRRDEFQRKNQEFEGQRAALLSQATTAANAEGLRLIELARKTADALSSTRQQALISEFENLNQAIRARTQSEVFSISRQVLTDLATTSLEERMVEVFTRNLRAMDPGAKAVLAESLKTATAPALIRTAFELPAEQRSAIQNAMNETFSADVHICFEIAPELVAGIELLSNGQKLSWSISGYLWTLEQSVEELMRGQNKRAS